MIRRVCKEPTERPVSRHGSSKLPSGGPPVPALGLRGSFAFLTPREALGGSGDVLRQARAAELAHKAGDLGVQTNYRVRLPLVPALPGPLATRWKWIPS